MDYDETRRWYDGYCFENVEHVYSPCSVVSAMFSKSFDSYWNQTETLDDALTLLIHLGYLGYDFSAQEVFIPNSEIASEFVTAVKEAGWQEVIDAEENSSGSFFGRARARSRSD